MINKATIYKKNNIKPKKIKKKNNDEKLESENADFGKKSGDKSDITTSCDAGECESRREIDSEKSNKYV